MKLIFIILSTAPVWVRAITGNEACNFVGARFARVVSTCERGLCSGILRDEKGVYLRNDEVGGNPVTCAGATEDMRSYLNITATDRRRSKRQRGQEPDERDFLSERIQSHLLPSLVALEVSGDMSFDDARREFAEFDAWAMTQASLDWTAWVESTSGSRASEVVTLTTLFNSLLLRTTCRALADDSAFGAISNLFFDVSALLGRPFGSAHWYLSVATEASLRYIPIYRSMSARDSPRAHTSRLGTPEDVLGMLQAFDSISGKNRDSSSSFTHNLLVMAGLPLRADDVTEHLFFMAMRARCADLERWLAWLLTGYPTPDLRTRLGVSWIDFCREHVNFVTLDQARRVVLRAIGAGQPLPVPMGPALNFLRMNRVLSFIPALDATDRVGFVSGLVKEVLSLPGFLHYTHSFSAIAFNSAQDAHVLGQAIGLAFLYGGDLTMLNLSPALLESLHPRARTRFMSRSEFESSGNNYQLGVFYWLDYRSLVSGVARGLGPGGAEMFTAEDWRARFAAPR